MDEIRFAPITTGDLDAYRDARLQALRDDPDAFSSVYEEVAAQPRSFWEDRVATNSKHELFSTHLAWSDQRVVGMASGVHLDDAETPELVAMWVAPEARGQGVGAKLVDLIGSWAESTGAEALELWVMTGNETAIGLYERCGFEIKKEHRASPNDPCRDEVRMRLELG